MKGNNKSKIKLILINNNYQKKNNLNNLEKI